MASNGKIPIVGFLEGLEGPDSGFDHEVIEAAGAQVACFDAKSEKERIELARNFKVLVVGSAPITQALLAELGNCVGIVRCGIGVDCVDIETATELGICVAQVPGFCVPEVAETTWSLILALWRRLIDIHFLVQRGGWRSPILEPIRRLETSVVGIVGLGQIGRAVALRGKGFGVKMLGFDPLVSEEDMRGVGVEKVVLDFLLAQSDIVTLHVPLSNKTRHLVNDEFISGMKKGAYLINTSRGGLIKEDALIRGLRSGHLSGTGLDVLEVEPPAGGHPLLGMDNVIVTPHYANYSRTSMSEMRYKISLQSAQLIKGELPLHLVNSSVVRSPRFRLAT